MTTASQLLQLGSAGGPFLTSVRDMDRYVVNSLNIKGFNGIDVSTIDAPDAWLAMEKQSGVVAKTAWSADTYKTLLDISGRGFLHYVIGPSMTASANGANSAIRVTVDGYPVEISTVRNTTGPGGGGRQVLGSLGDSGTDDYLILFTDNPIRNDNGHVFINGRQPYLMGKNGLSRLNKLLKYESSLKVEIKVSEALSAASGHAYKAAVLYSEAN